MSDQESLTEGQTIPEISLPRDGGGTVSLSDFPGRTIVLFAYGKDGTPACTSEALEFQALATDFEAAGAVVIGLSKDTVASHQKFAARQGLTMILASDHGGSLMEDWGAFGEKQMYGKTVRGVLRRTFLIRDGKVLKVMKVARVKGHAAEVLEAAKAL